MMGWRDRRADQRPDIQGLRALAVLAVIADHLLAWPAGGFVGVDVFFVISGFLITGVLLREYERDAHISFRNFYRRRVKRIVPAAALVVLTTAAVSFVVLGHDRFVKVAWDSVGALFFFSNWRFAAAGTDYFQEGLPPSPLQHYWSLSVEEQFYFVWPWLMLGLMLVGSRLFGWGRQHLRVVTGSTIAVITAASFGWAMWETANSSTVAYFSSLSRTWELGLGALVAIGSTKLAFRSTQTRTVLAYVGLAAIVVSLFVVPSSGGFPAPWAALPVAGTALVILAGIGGDQPHLQPLTNAGSGYVGTISYSLYLWHFPVIILLATLVPTGTFEFYAIALVLIAALSVASFHLVEDPARRSIWLHRSSRVRPEWADGWRWVVVVPVAIITVSLVAAGFVRDHQPQPASSPFADARTGGDSTTAPKTPRCVGAAALDPAENCPLNTGDEMFPAPADAPDDIDISFRCWIALGQPMRTCSYGSTRKGALKVALLGDSHAAMLLPGLVSQLGARNWHLDSYVGYGCQWMAPGAPGECGKTMADIQKRVETGPKYDLVIVTAARQVSPADKDYAARLFSQAWKPVTARGTKVVAVADNPGVPAASLECVNRLTFKVTDNDCATPEKEADAVVDPLVKAARDTPGAALVDMEDFFCVDDLCPMVIGNVTVYRDFVGHMTATYSYSLGPYLVQRIAHAAGL